MEGEHKTSDAVMRAVGDVKQGRGEKDVQDASGGGATLAQVKRVIDVSCVNLSKPMHLTFHINSK